MADNYGRQSFRICIDHLAIECSDKHALTRSVTRVGPIIRFLPQFTLNLCVSSPFDVIGCELLGAQGFVSTAETKSLSPILASYNSYTIVSRPIFIPLEIRTAILGRLSLIVLPQSPWKPRVRLVWGWKMKVVTSFISITMAHFSALTRSR